MVPTSSVALSLRTKEQIHAALIAIENREARVITDASDGVKTGRWDWWLAKRDDGGREIRCSGSGPGWSHPVERYSIDEGLRLIQRSRGKRIGR